MATHKVRTPHFPTHAEVRFLAQLWDGVPKATVKGMIYALFDQTGTPQNPVDWSNPDVWIPERLSGDFATLAMRIWDESNHASNPRHIYGTYLLINGYRLLEPDAEGVYRRTKFGKNFVLGDPQTVRELDDVEGVLEILRILSGKSHARFGDLIPEWSAFLKEHSKFGAASTINDTLRRRLGNIIERGLAVRESGAYTITEAGLHLLESTGESDHQRRQVLRVIDDYNRAQREALKAQLAGMHPYKFEHLVKELLSAMGYEDATVTKASGDKGIDVIATVQFGITSITEFVQVKRTLTPIQRPILDRLRGCLPFHSALRGTIITLGDYSKGCLDAALFPGAAPITLINGDRLLDLLIEHEIGVTKRMVALNDVDADFLTAFEEEATGELE